MGIRSKLAKARALLREGGVPRLIEATGAFLGGRPPFPAGPPVLDRRVVDHRYVAEFGALEAAPGPDFVREHDARSLVINWLVPPFEVGSGGHMTIFRMIRNLEALGHRNRIYILFGDPAVHDAQAIKRTIDEHFVRIDAPVLLEMNAMADSDVVFATSWPTAYPLRAVRNTLLKAYFVQDYEPSFYPQGSEWYFAEATYRFGYHHLTAGPWLAAKLRAEYGAAADAFELSCDRAVYRPLDVPRPNARFRVLFYARPATPRRCFELGLLALERFWRRYPEQVEIVAIGGELSRYELGFPVTDLGVVGLAELPALYATIDLALVHSSTNCSLLPLELMACRVPVIDLAVPNVEGTLAHGRNAWLAEPTPWAIADALELLYRDGEQRRALAERGWAHAQAQPSWEDAARVVERSLLAQLNRRARRPAAPDALGRPAGSP